ncbi:MAG: sialidase family protein [Myxococcota bacterium]|nr:sialidase family protein [Myxococcota bacterium]
MFADKCLVPLFAVLLMTPACGGSTSDSGTTADEMGSTEAPATMSPTRVERAGNKDWTIEQISADTSGVTPTIAVSDTGAVGVAFFASDSTEGDECTELAAGGTETLPNKQFLKVYFGSRSGSSWSIDVAHDTLVLNATPPGLDLAYEGDTPQIATLVGEAYGRLRHCAANDLGIVSRANGAWSVETIVKESDEAAADTNPELSEAAEASDAGFAVGYQAALAKDTRGQLGIVYRDIHDGGLQADDQARADVEMAWQLGGGWKNIMVSQGIGGGEHTGLVFDSQNRPVVLYTTAQEKEIRGQSVLGLWIARSSDEGDTWDKIKLFEGVVTSKPDLAVGPDGGLYVAYYDNAPDRKRGVLFHLPDGGMLGDDWVKVYLDEKSYIGGQEPSIAFDSSGRPAVSFYRCGKTTDADCTDRNDGLVLGYVAEIKGIDFEDWDWTYELVDGGDKGRCGRASTLVFDSQDRANIAYECTVQQGDEFGQFIKYARRKAVR